MPPGKVTVIPHGVLAPASGDDGLPAELAAVEGPVALFFGLLRPVQGPRRPARGLARHRGRGAVGRRHAADGHGRAQGVGAARRALRRALRPGRPGRGALPPRRPGRPAVPRDRPVRRAVHRARRRDAARPERGRRLPRDRGRRGGGARPARRRGGAADDARAAARRPRGPRAPGRGRRAARPRSATGGTPSRGGISTSMRGSRGERVAGDEPRVVGRARADPRRQRPSTTSRRSWPAPRSSTPSRSTRSAPSTASRSSIPSATSASTRSRGPAGARTSRGLDFSAPAVEAARALADRAGLDAEFVQADVYDAVAALGAPPLRRRLHRPRGAQLAAGRRALGAGHGRPRRPRWSLLPLRDAPLRRTCSPTTR